MFLPTTRAPLLPAGTRVQRFSHMLSRMAQRGVALAEGVYQACTGATALPLSSPIHAEKVRAFTRIARAVQWATALSALLAGAYRLPVRRARAPTLAAPSLIGARSVGRLPSKTASVGPPSRPLGNTAAPRIIDRGDDRWMHIVFATRPIGRIVARLCRTLGIDEHTELWPAELIALAQTPAEWAAGPPPHPPPHPPQCPPAACSAPRAAPAATRCPRDERWAGSKQPSSRRMAKAWLRAGGHPP